MFNFQFSSLVPESIRWLLAHGQLEKAQNVIDWVSRVNRRDEIHSILQTSRRVVRTPILLSDYEIERNERNDRNERNTGVVEILKRGVMLRRMANIAFAWLVLLISNHYDYLFYHFLTPENPLGYCSLFRL